MSTPRADTDVLVVGAGITGIHQLHRALEEGFTAGLVEAGHGVGGTWFWNRYPGATKAAVIQLAKVAAVEYARDGIRVNCVCPGTFRSGIHDDLPEGALEAIAARHPLGLGAAEDLVKAYSYLAGDGSRWTTGSALVVDGGYAAP